jgi:hypothetical protein
VTSAGLEGNCSGEEGVICDPPAFLQVGQGILNAEKCPLQIRVYDPVEVLLAAVHQWADGALVALIARGLWPDGYRTRSARKRPANRIVITLPIT